MAPPPVRTSPEVGPGATVGTPGPGDPLLLSLGKSLVVIVNYALTTERPDPCGPEPYSPGKRPRTRSPLEKGPVAPRISGVALSQNSWGPRTFRGVPDLPGVPDPCRVPDPDPHTLSGPLSGVELTPRLGLVRNRHVSRARPQVRARARGRELPLEESPTYRIQCSRRKCALP